MTNKELFEAAAGLLCEYVTENEKWDDSSFTSESAWVAAELTREQTRNLAQWFQAESHATTYNPASLRLARSLVEDE